MPTIHAVLVCYNNPAQTAERYFRDMDPGLSLTGLNTVVTVVDNSVTSSDDLSRRFGNDYVWNDGKNLMYGGAINQAVARVPSDFVLYCCSRHGRAYDPTWVIDILSPVVKLPEVGQAGHLMGSNSPQGLVQWAGPGYEWVKDKYWFEEGGTQVVPPHVQGGVFAAKTELMLRFPYPEKFNHMYSDHILTWEILKAGFKVYNIPTICSVWRNKVTERRSEFKYIHEEE